MADESSRKFYDETYKFTKDTSTLLGRIESGFGSYLQNLNANYERIGNSIERMSPKTAAIKQIVEQTNVDKAMEDTQRMVAELTTRAKLSKAEKAKIQTELAQTQARLSSSSGALAAAQMEAANLRAKMSSTVDPKQEAIMKTSSSLFDASSLPRDRGSVYSLQYFLTYVWDNFDENELQGAGDDFFLEKSLSQSDRETLKAGGLMTDDGRLKPAAVTALRQVGYRK